VRGSSGGSRRLRLKAAVAVQACLAGGSDSSGSSSSCYCHSRQRLPAAAAAIGLVVTGLVERRQCASMCDVLPYVCRHVLTQQQCAAGNALVCCHRCTDIIPACICRWCVGSGPFELANLSLRSLVAFCVSHAREFDANFGQRALSSTMEHAAKQVPGTFAAREVSEGVCQHPCRFWLEVISLVVFQPEGGAVFQVFHRQGSQCYTCAFHHR
jgi:hypothetical protein